MRPFLPISPKVDSPFTSLKIVWFFNLPNIIMVRAEGLGTEEVLGGIAPGVRVAALGFGGCTGRRGDARNELLVCP